MNKQIYFKKAGQSDWEAVGPIRNLRDFNRDFADWVAKYDDKFSVETWDEALDVLNSVGASAWAGIFCLGAE